MNNLNELRLKALLSLKRNLPSPTSENLELKKASSSSSPPPPPTQITPNLSSITQNYNDKEEGELTDYEDAENSSESDQINYKRAFKDIKKNFFKLPPPSIPSTNKKLKYTWTRDQDNFDSLTNESLESLMDMKSNLLCKLDDNQSLLAASEDHEQDLLAQLEECRNLQRKCEVERFKLEKEFEKLLNLIIKKENFEYESNRKVSSTNYKKLFVGKMLKESYCPSFSSKFSQSKLYKIYCETLEIDPESFSFIHKKIDPQIPFCETELICGKCPFIRETCTLQHIESLKNCKSILKRDPK